MNTKLIVALVIVGVLAVTVVGLGAAQAVSTPAPNGTTGTTQSGGFFGWMGRFMGFRSTYTGAYYNETQTPANVGPSSYIGQPENITVTDPNTGTTTTYQGYYGNGCGMMRGFP
jgi:hypothetical protein